MPGTVLNALHKLINSIIFTTSSQLFFSRCSFPISQIKKTEAQRDDIASQGSRQDSNPGRLTLLAILSAEETVKAKVLGRERLTSSSESAGLEKSAQRLVQETEKDCGLWPWRSRPLLAACAYCMLFTAVCSTGWRGLLPSRANDHGNFCKVPEIVPDL